MRQAPHVVLQDVDVTSRLTCQPPPPKVSRRNMTTAEPARRSMRLSEAGRCGRTTQYDQTCRGCASPRGHDRRLTHALRAPGLRYRRRLPGPRWESTLTAGEASKFAATKTRRSDRNGPTGRRHRDHGGRSRPGARSCSRVRVAPLGGGARTSEAISPLTVTPVGSSSVARDCDSCLERD